MTEFSLADVVASVSRALWGEVSGNLRSVQFRLGDQRIELRFFFDGEPGDTELDSINNVGAAVAADFPNYRVSEEALTTDGHQDIPCQDDWHPAYVRREPTFAR